MKNKMTFALLGLSLLLAGGTAGALTSKTGVELDAAASTTKTFYLAPNANWKVGNARFAMYMISGSLNKWASMTDADGDGIYEGDFDTAYSTVIFCRMNPATTANNWDNKWNQTADLSVKDLGDKNLYTVAEGTWDKGGGTWSVKGQVLHKVTFDLGYKVAGGEGNYLSFADVAHGETATAPKAMVYGKKAVWSPSLDTPINEDTTFTATWVADNTEKDEFYYVLDYDDALPLYVYGWNAANSYPFGPWPGTPISVDDITTVLHVNVGENFAENEGKVVRIQVPAGSMTNIQFNKEDDWKTGDLVYSAGVAYFGSEDLEGSVAKGAAVGLILDTENARNAVVANGDIKQYSICGIPQAKAKSLYERYVALEDRSLFGRTVTKTYIDEDEGNVNYADIMEQVGLIGGISNNALHYAMNNGTNNSATYLVMGLVLLTAIAVSAFAIVRKKKTR
ncbi:MAG: hypothetical protein ACI32C_05810 [Candidatus Enteromonas sp.]